MLQEPVAAKDGRHGLHGRRGESELGSTTFDSGWPFGQSATEHSATASSMDVTNGLGGANSLDEICDQIRKLRSSILPQGSPLQRDELLAQHVPAVSSRASPQAVSSGTSPQAVGSRASPQIASNRALPRGGDAAAGGAVASTRGALAVGGISAPSPRKSPRRRLRHTLWEERQLERCLKGWRNQCGVRDLSEPPFAPPSRVVSRGLDEDQASVEPVKQVHQVGNAHNSEQRFGLKRKPVDRGLFDMEQEDALARTDDSKMSEAATRVDLCFRVWRRLCAARRATEIAQSVKVLDAQVSRQLRRAVARWFQKSKEKRNDKVPSNLRVTTRRHALRWWRKVANQSGQSRALHDQVCMVRRMHMLRHATKLWASNSSCSVLWRSFFNRQGSRFVKFSMDAWKSAHTYCKDKVATVKGNTVILQALKRRSALRWWIERVRRASRCHQLQQQLKLRLQLSAKAIAWRRLAACSERTQQHVNRSKDAVVSTCARQQRLALQKWSRWFRRRGRLRGLAGVLAAKLQPRLMQKIVRSWLSVVRRKQRHDVALQKAKIVMALSMKHRTFVGWSGVAKVMARALSALRSLASHLSQDGVKNTFALWRAATAAARRDRECHALAQMHDDRRILFQCFLELRDYAIACKQHSHLIQISFGHHAKTMAALSFCQWRRFLNRQRFEEDFVRRGLLKQASRNTARYFNLWCASVADVQIERLRSTTAERKRTNVLVPKAFKCLAHYAAQRRSKSHRGPMLECANLMIVMRRKQVLDRWMRNRHAQQLRAKVSFTMSGRVARAVFEWGHDILAKHRLAEDVRAITCRRLQHRTLRILRNALRAADFCRASYGCNLLAWTFSLWQAVQHATIEDATDRIRLGLWQQDKRRLRFCIRAFWAEMLERRQLKSRVQALANALQVVADLRHLEAQASTIDSWQIFVDSCRAVDDAQLQYNLMQQQSTCFQHWVQFCTQQAAKRSVHVVCGKYRERRLLRSVFQCWHVVHVRLGDTARSVLMLAAGLATQNAQECLVTWHQYSRRRVNAVRASKIIVENRRVEAWTSWQFSLKRKFYVSMIFKIAAQNRLRAWLRAWSSQASVKAASRRRHTIATQAVKSARQRQIIDRWCEAGRWNRLGHVAEEWDQQVMSRQLLRGTLREWSNVIYVGQKAEKCMVRLGKMRARAHVRKWNQLKRTMEVRPRSNARQCLRLWRYACARVIAYKQAVRRLPLKAGFDQLRAHQKESTKLKQSMEQRTQAVEKASTRRKRADCLKQWRLFSSEMRRVPREQPPKFHEQRNKGDKKRLLSQWLHWTQQQRRVKASDTAAKAKARQLWEKRSERGRKTVIAEWREAYRHKKAMNLRRDYDLRFFNLGTLLEDGASSFWNTMFSAWSAHCKKRRESRAAGETTKQKLAELRQSRLFDQWAKVYELQSSSFFASQILARSKLTRLVAEWFRLATFNKRFAVHVSHVQVLQGQQLLQRCFRIWYDALYEHRCLAALHLDRYRHRSFAFLMAWKTVVDDRQKMREALRDFKSLTRSMKSRRGAELLRLSRVSVMYRVCFEAYATWTRRVQALRAREVELKQRVTSERQLRRLCSWTMAARALEFAAMPPCVGLSSIFESWVFVHRLELFKARGVLDLLGRGNANLLVQLMRPWLELAWEGRHDRRALRQFQRSQLLRQRCYGLNRWKSWITRRRGHRGALHLHRGRWIKRTAQLLLQEWSRQIRHDRIEDRIGSSKTLRMMHIHFRAWCTFFANWVHKSKCGHSIAHLKTTQVSRTLLVAWADLTRRHARIMKMVNALERARRKWRNEQEWRSAANQDDMLRTMFQRFTIAFEQQRAGWSSITHHSEGFETLITLIWERQQMSVALGRLRGYPQPWVLGSWRVEDTPLLPAGSPYYTQTEFRLAAMVSRLEAHNVEDQVMNIYSSLYGSGDSRRPGLEQRVCMWQALADLVVVYRPGWPSNAQSPTGALSMHMPLPYQASSGHNTTFGLAPPSQPMQMPNHWAQPSEHAAFPLMRQCCGQATSHQAPGQLASIMALGAPPVDATPVFGFRATSAGREPLHCGVAHGSQRHHGGGVISAA